MPSYNKTIRSSQTLIGKDEPCYVIAEIGSNHAGDIDVAKDQIRSAAQSGADAVKFQIFHAEEFLSDKELTYQYEDQTGEEIEVNQYEMFKQLELPDDWIPSLIEKATEFDVDWFASVADEESLETVLNYQVPFIKLASEDIINVGLLEKVQEINKPVIVSRGMANDEEICEALSILSPESTPDLILLHCLSCYPTPEEELNLKQIRTLRETFGCLTGFSDHTENPLPAVLAVAKGAKVIEKHFTIDQSLPGPDQAMSTTPEEFNEMVHMIRRSETLLGERVITVAECERENRITMRRGIVADKNIQKGQLITTEDIAFRRPCKGLNPFERYQVIGQTATHKIPKNKPITSEDIE